MFEGKTVEEVYKILEKDPELLETVKQVSELRQGFKDLSEEDKEMIIKTCDSLGAIKLSSALRTIAENGSLQNR